MKITCWLVLILLVVPAFAARRPSLFRYDASQPLALKEISAENHDAFVLHDLKFNDVAGQSMTAYMIVPNGQGPFPAVLYVHWLGDPDTSNRTEFLQEAEEIAKHGAIALLVDMPWSIPGWFRNRKLNDDYDFSIRQVQNLRRAMDVLARRPDVDPKRIAYVGHDFGATYGSILLGVDSRIHCAVLMAGTPILSDWLLLGWKVEDEERAAYVKKMTPLDPVNFIGEAKSVPILLQFAANDRFIAKDKAELFANSAKEPKDLRWYESDHELNEQAASDRSTWLEQHLSLTHIRKQLIRPEWHLIRPGGHMTRTKDQDRGKGAVEQESREQPSNTSMVGQLGHRDQDPLIKSNDSDFPEPGKNEEHSGEDKSA